TAGTARGRDDAGATGGVLDALHLEPAIAEPRGTPRGDVAFSWPGGVKVGADRVDRDELLGEGDGVERHGSTLSLAASPRADAGRWRECDTKIFRRETCVRQSRDIS